MTYINQLKIHLNQVGITTSIEMKEEHNAFTAFANQIQSQKVNRIFYSLSETFIERLRNSDPIAQLERCEPWKRRQERGEYYEVAVEFFAKRTCSL